MPAPDSPPKPPRAGHQRRVARGALLLVLPGLLTSLGLLWTVPMPAAARLAASALLLSVTALAAHALRERLAYSLRTLANVIAAMRDGDFSIRPYAASPRSAGAGSSVSAGWLPLAGGGGAAAPSSPSLSALRWARNARCARMTAMPAPLR